MFKLILQRDKSQKTLQNGAWVRLYFIQTWPKLLMSCTQEVVNTYAKALKHFVQILTLTTFLNGK